MPEEKVNWKDVEDYINWYDSDDHDFDIWLNQLGEKVGYKNVKTGKKYSVRELFNFWLTHVKDS